MDDSKRRCIKCGIEKTISEFGARSRRVDGYSTICKECHNAYYRQYCTSNKDKIRDISKRERDRNRIAYKIRYKKYSHTDRFKTTQTAMRKKWAEGWYKILRSKFGDPYCQVCGEKLKWPGERSSLGTVSFDHRHGYGNSNMRKPSQWILRHSPFVQKNVDLFTSEDFGHLCRFHNRYLETDNTIRRNLLAYLKYLEE